MPFPGDPFPSLDKPKQTFQNKIRLANLNGVIFLLGMGRIHYPAGAPAGYPVSGGKIGRIAGYHFGINFKLSKVKWKYAEKILNKIFINLI